MPTTRNRLLVTESDELTEALDQAATRWPEERSRTRLLVRLALVGNDHLEARHESAIEARLAAILANAGSLGGCYGEDYLRDLRADWPA